jgi:hypothetical protein
MLCKGSVTMLIIVGSIKEVVEIKVVLVYLNCRAQQATGALLCVGVTWTLTDQGKV